MNDRLSDVNAIIGFCVGLLVANAIQAQEVPEGVRYKPAAAEVNAAAKRMLEQALKGPGVKAADLLGDQTTCGPTLWNDLKASASEVLRKAKVVDLFLETPRVVHVEGRALVAENERVTFWSTVLAKYPALATAQVRAARKDEILYYWATVAFDIEEPLFTVEAGPDRFVANFIDNDGTLALLWFDRVGDLAKIGTPVPGANASEASARFLQSTMLLQDWTRHSFAYDGGATVSAMFPRLPEEHASPAKAGCNPSITMTGHIAGANAESINVNLIYTSRISRKVAELSDKERSCVLAAVASTWLSGVVRRLNESGSKVEPKPGPMQQTTIGGYPAIEQEIVIEPMKCRIRMALIGEFAYGGVAMWKSDGNDDLALAFLDSLRVE